MKILTTLFHDKTDTEQKTRYNATSVPSIHQIKVLASFSVISRSYPARQRFLKVLLCKDM